MTREEKMARAVELREQGVFYDEIATYLAVSRTTVVRWTNPNYAEHDRSTSLTWKQRNRERNRERNRARDRQRAQETKVPCPHCGTHMAPTSDMCQGCHDAAAGVRRSLIEGMWADGWPGSVIAKVAGVSFYNRLGEMRNRGWDLPHRRQGEALANLRASNPWLRDR